jgi:hypothetical protein
MQTASSAGGPARTTPGLRPAPIGGSNAVTASLILRYALSRAGVGIESRLLTSVNSKSIRSPLVRRSCRSTREHRRPSITNHARRLPQRRRLEAGRDGDAHVVGDLGRRRARSSSNRPRCVHRIRTRTRERCVQRGSPGWSEPSAAWRRNAGISARSV